jgi:hypothetical protein
MGKGLQKITRSRRAKLPLVIKEGKTRPSVPLIAAKFATESNILVRNHLPVFPHWKEYKKQTQVLDQFMGGLKVKYRLQASLLVSLLGTISNLIMLIMQLCILCLQLKFDMDKNDCGRTNLNYTGSSTRVHSRGLQRASNGIIPWPVG